MKTFPIFDQQRIEAIMKSCQYCTIGVVDENGIPYVIPMNFGYENNTIYLHSAQEGRSIRALEKNPNICITFCTNSKIVYQNIEVACSYSAQSESVICEGKVEFVEDFDEKVHALNATMKQYSDRTFSYSTPAVSNVKIWKVAIEKISAKEFGAKRR
ncbi:MAG: pyridoxamine 5'-phosphate oxidase family protein [Dysgonamonadaceae bacterium]|nr:pyridoxamine 5'-phosphate oxidase family protein [Dysgonamonadaceae bacterium]